MNLKELNLEQQVFFSGKKMSMQEFLDSCDMSADDNGILIVINKLIKKGKLRILDDPKENDFQTAFEDLELDSAISDIEEDDYNTEKYRRAKKKEGQLIFELIEIDFPSRQSVQDMLEYCAKRMIVSSAEARDGLYVLTLENISESELAGIRRYQFLNKTGANLTKTADGIAKHTVNTVAFTAQNVVLPATRAGLTAALGVVKTVLKTGTQVGSNIITNTTMNAKTMKKELSTDHEVLKAKRDLIDAKDSIMRFFKSGSSSSGIRYIK
jgi:hypothetical protein